MYQTIETIRNSKLERNIRFSFKKKYDSPFVCYENFTPRV